MTCIRSDLLGLPFVNENPDGTLNMWDVTPTGDPEYDHTTGRVLAMAFLELCRRYQTPGLLYQVSATRRSRATRDKPAEVIWSGFLEAHAEAVLTAPPGSSVSMTMVSGRNFDPGDVRGALLSLPFVHEVSPGGEIQTRLPPQSGSYAEDNAQGRYCGALLAKFIQDTGQYHLLGEFSHAVREETAAGGTNTGLLVGVNHVISEIAMNSSFEAIARHRTSPPIAKDDTVILI